MTLPDAQARQRALTDLQSTLLVEAAAGTGKTSIMAGRAAMLLASGCRPRHLAAITFTELAAGELSVRIRQIVGSLLAGEIPRVLEIALPNGLSSEQQNFLKAAAVELDELTSTTIHGFCQRIIQAYAVEADVDPGAAVMDAAAADAMFDGVFDRWLGRTLSSAEAGSGPIAVLAEDDPLRVVATLRDLANLKRKHPTAKAPAVDLSTRPDLEFAEVVTDFQRWFARQPGEPKTADVLDQLQALSDFFSNDFATSLNFRELWRLSKPPRQPLMKKDQLEWRNYACKAAWQKVAQNDVAADLNAQAEAHYEKCHRAFEILMGKIAGALVAELSSALDHVVADYGSAKRAAAVLDFDDLLDRAAFVVRENETVRQALGRRYQHIFVDEFQDTDPLQSEIIFSIAATERPSRWDRARLRPGSVFLVGDPKQAIYRFRGAHIGTYKIAYDAIKSADPANIIQITANFRSAPGIIDHVNRCFESVLEQEGQPGYVALTTTVPPPESPLPSVAKVTVQVPPRSNTATQRDEEAELIANVCRSLVGAINVRRDDGSQSPLRPGDIALLAPWGTELWRYERALEAVRLSVASQAGRALMRRQEAQDFLTLARTLADPADTVAFGALMRGPLVGLTEQQLLDVTGALRASQDDQEATFSMRTDPAQVSDPIARETLVVLRDLRRRAAILTPFALLSEAVERLKVRVALTLRNRDRNSRALSNLDALLNLAKSYGIEGLKEFASDLNALWERQSPVAEGRSDSGDDSIAIVTVHSAKGLEWPVVIPINTCTWLRSADEFVYRPSDNTLHWVIGGVAPPDLEAAQFEDAESAARERERIWYVGCTRARDLLIIPSPVEAGEKTWARIIDLSLSDLPELSLDTLSSPKLSRSPTSENEQTAESFVAESAKIAERSPSIRWKRPSDHDPDRVRQVESAEVTNDAVESVEIVGAGHIRGILIHKLLEELITGELVDDEATVSARSSDLLNQLWGLSGSDRTDGPDPVECAAAALRALNLPEIAELRPTLMTEVPIYGEVCDGTLLSGRADAIAVESGRVTTVIDWKSDIAPTEHDRAAHAGQLCDYLTATNAPRGAVVYVTLGQVSWVEQPPLSERGLNSTAF